MILLVGPSTSRAGGVSTWIRNLREALAANEPRRAWIPFVTDKGGPKTRPLPQRLSDGARVSLQFRAELQATKPALVHICCSQNWGFREAALFVRLARAQEARVLLHCHAPDFADYWARSVVDRPLIRSTLRSVDAVAVLSSADVKPFESFGASPGHVVPIPNGVPLLAWSARAAVPGSTETPLSLCVLASVEERKGIDVLIDATERVHRARGAVLRVQVLGPMQCEARQYQRWLERGRKCGIHFKGAVDPREAQAQLAASDGLVLPSRAEGLPYAVLEAMAAGRPVLTTRCGALPELLEGKAGDLVDPGDPVGLAEQLLRWVDDPSHREDIAQRGHQRIQERHTIQHQMNATVALWDRVLACSTPSAS